MIEKKFQKFLLPNLKTIITLNRLFISTFPHLGIKGDHYHALKIAGPVQLILVTMIVCRLLNLILIVS
jgi:hypothetical protein